MFKTPWRAEKINKIKVPCLDFIKKVKSLHKLEHSNFFPPYWEGKIKECVKVLKKGEKFSIWNKMVLNIC